MCVPDAAIICRGPIKEIDRLLAEVEKLMSLCKTTADAMQKKYMRDGGSYWLPAHQNDVEDWSAALAGAIAPVTPPYTPRLAAWEKDQDAADEQKTEPGQ